MTERPTEEAIDALLPQTQCGLCGFGGCLPYAKAMVDGKASINLCPPGGLDTLYALGEALGCSPLPYQADMQAKALPPRVAVIREAECIGCTKCIQACPVDAIIGSAKLMHTVITDACTGCELCIPPCPVDCIDLQPSPSPTTQTPQTRRERFQAHNQRLIEKNKPKQAPSKEERQRQLAAVLARIQTNKPRP